MASYTTFDNNSLPPVAGWTAYLQRLPPGQRQGRSEPGYRWRQG